MVVTIQRIVHTLSRCEAHIRNTHNSRSNTEESRGFQRIEARPLYTSLTSSVRVEATHMQILCLSGHKPLLCHEQILLADQRLDDTLLNILISQKPNLALGELGRKHVSKGKSHGPLESLTCITCAFRDIEYLMPAYMLFATAYLPKCETVRIPHH